MLLSITLALLIALLASGIVLFSQGLLLRAEERAEGRKGLVQNLARRHHGVVDPIIVAKELEISIPSADRLLRNMVDDVDFTMGIDEERGMLEFWFPALTDRSTTETGSRRRRRI